MSFDTHNNNKTQIKHIMTSTPEHVIVIHTESSSSSSTYADKNVELSEDGLPMSGRNKRKVEECEYEPSVRLEEEETSQIKKPRTVSSKVKPTPQVLAVRRELQRCCRNNDLGRAIQIYHHATNDDDGTLVEAQSLYNILNLCDGLGERPVHIGTPKMTNHKTTNDDDDDEPQNHNNNDEDEPIQPIDAETRLSFAFRIKQDMDDRKLPLNETAYTALIRILASSQRVDEAAQLLREAEATQQCKMRLRLYSSLLTTYCDMDAMDQVIDLWVRLDREKLTLTEREYSAMIQSATRIGNAALVERFLSELAEDILVPGKETIQALVAWFQSSHATYSNDDQPNTHTLGMEPPTWVVPCMGPVVASSTWSIDSGCTIKDGVLQTGCLKGHTLQPVPLSKQAWQEMIEYNESIVLQGMVDGHASNFQGGGKGPKRKFDLEARRRNWNFFKTFLATKYEGGIDIVIDGANIGYYKQNFTHAPKHVDYRQIDGVVQHFLKLNKRVLLILHARHFANTLMPVWAKPIVEGWSSILYKANPGMNDDWFWLHAALWGRASVVTNDEMRDHHFQMLSPRSFVRWKERQQIHFHFEVIDGIRMLKPMYPATYSRRIQRIGSGLVIPLAKRGDENRFVDGVHIATSTEPEEETYLCVCPSSNSNVKTD